jgi:hypothetical protein
MCICIGWMWRRVQGTRRVHDTHVHTLYTHTLYTHCTHTVHTSTHTVYTHRDTHTHDAYTRHTHTLYARIHTHTQPIASGRRDRPTPSAHAHAFRARVRVRSCAACDHGVGGDIVGGDRDARRRARDARDDDVVATGATRRWGGDARGGSAWERLGRA